MRASCFQAVERVAVQRIADPIIEHEGDALVRVDLAGLCGSDLHPYLGRERGLDPGTVMGHEFVGSIVEIGAGLSDLRVGDRVLTPFSTSCGTCFFCSRGLTSRCPRGQLFGWRQGGLGLHGGQAEYVRVPLAEGTLMRIPEWVDDDTALLLGDNLSTGYFCADLLEIADGGVYAAIGCGTVGLLAVQSAFSLGAERVLAIDPVAERAEVCARLGAEVYSDEETFRLAVQDASSGRGADGVMELVGSAQAQELAFDIVRPGGVLAAIGCNCTNSFPFGPVDAYDKNLVFRTGRCPARHYMSLLSRKLQRSPMDLDWCITHRFPLDAAAKAYTIFSGRQDGCIKAVLDVRGGKS